MVQVLSQIDYKSKLVFITWLHMTQDNPPPSFVVIGVMNVVSTKHPTKAPGRSFRIFEVKWVDDKMVVLHIIRWIYRPVEKNDYESLSWFEPFFLFHIFISFNNNIFNHILLFLLEKQEYLNNFILYVWYTTQFVTEKIMNSNLLPATSSPVNCLADLSCCKGFNNINSVVCLQIVAKSKFNLQIIHCRNTANYVGSTFFLFLLLFKKQINKISHFI